MIMVSNADGRRNMIPSCDSTPTTCHPHHTVTAMTSSLSPSANISVVHTFRRTLLLLCIVGVVGGRTGGGTVDPARDLGTNADDAASYGGGGYVTVRDGYFDVYTPVGDDVTEVEDAMSTSATTGTFAICGQVWEGCLGIYNNDDNEGVDDDGEMMDDFVEDTKEVEVPSPSLTTMKAIIGPLDGIGTLEQQWTYQEGLLITKNEVLIGGNGNAAPKRLCLGPTMLSLMSSTQTYPLVLQECPTFVRDKVSNNGNNRSSNSNHTRTSSRHLRFWMREDGMVQSLAPVLDLVSGQDISETHPYCMTLSKMGASTKMAAGNGAAATGSQIVLQPCQHKSLPTPPSQQFLFFGSFQFFMVPLEPLWGGYQDSIQVAYSAGSRGINVLTRENKGTGQQALSMGIAIGNKPVVQTIISTNPSGLATFDLKKALMHSKSHDFHSENMGRVRLSMVHGGQEYATFIAMDSVNTVITREPVERDTLEVNPGNILSNGSLALCAPQGCLGVKTSSTSNFFQAQLVPLDEMMKNNDDDDSKLPLQWTYQTGLLKTTLQKGDDVQEQCLSPGVTSLSSNTHSYRLFLQDCRSDTSMGGRYQRYLIDSVTGRVQSLAPVFDLTSGKDISHASPYCLTVEDYSKTKYKYGSSTNIATPIVLMPCQDLDNVDTDNHQQFFQPQGTSEPFLFSLQPIWGNQDIVQIAYSVGFNSSNNAQTPPALFTGDALTIGIDLGSSVVRSIVTTDLVGIATFDGLERYGYKPGNPLRVSFVLPNDDDNEDTHYLMYSVSVQISPEQAHVDHTGHGNANSTAVKNCSMQTHSMAMMIAMLIAGTILVVAFANIGYSTRKQQTRVKPFDMPVGPEGQNDEETFSGLEFEEDEESVV